MHTTSRRRRARGAATGLAALLIAGCGVSLGAFAAPAAAASRPATPDLVKASAYLVAPAQLSGGHYYDPSGPGFADFGLTIDGALSLAATGGHDAALAKIVAFLRDGGQDGSQRTIDSWTGIGTAYVSGGSLAKEALLAEVVGDDPHAFGGHDLLAALDAAVCARASTGNDTSCPAPGAYSYGSSVFSQALGVIAQLRAGDGKNASAAVAYLEGLQHADGSWPSLLPASGDSDVDSSAMAVMALALVPGDTASAAVGKGIAWIAGRQEKDGGFPGAAGDSTNSAALAVQALTLDKAAEGAPIAGALAFLAGEQNRDGGFSVAAGDTSGSNLRAGAQIVGGATGIPFGTLSHPLTGTGGGGASPSTSASPTPSASPSVTAHPTPSASGTPTAVPTPTVSTITGGTTGDGGTTTGGTVTGGRTGTGGQLAATGGDVRAAGTAAAAMILTGALTVLATRRRRVTGGNGR